MSTQTVTTANFAQSSDEQIISAAREVINRAQQQGAQLPAKLRRLVRARRPDVMVAGKFLWAHLCGWKSGQLT